MKKLAFYKKVLLFFVFFYSFSVYAQIGVKAGIGFSDIIFVNEGQEPYLGYEVNHLTHNYPLFTYQIGAFANINLNHHFDFQPELMLIRQGINYDTQYAYQNITYRLYIWYIQAPLLFRYKFSLKKKHQPNFSLGPYFSAKVSAKKITNYDGDSQTENMENVKPYDIGFIAGFGYDFNLQSGQIVAELRAGYSLINTMDTQDGHIPESYGPENLKARNVSLMVTFGYRFTHLTNKSKSK